MWKANHIGTRFGDGCRGLGGVWRSRDKKYRGELGTRIAGTRKGFGLNQVEML